MEYRKLKDLVEINSESITKSYNKEKINYLDTSNITNGKIDNIVELNIKNAPSRAKRIVRENDIIYSTVRPNLCHYGILRKTFTNMIVSTGFAVLRCKKEILPEYLYAYITLPSITMKMQAIAETSTSAYPSIKPKDLEDIEIILPSIHTQQRISQVLLNIDKKIELNNQINDNLLESCKSVFKQWFIDYKYPNSNGIMKDSLLGKIPIEWNICEVQEITKIKRGASPRPIQDYISNNGVNWLKIADVTGIKEPFIYNIKEKIKEEGKEKSNFIEKGTLVVSNSATPGIPKFIEVDTCVHDGWLVLYDYRDYYKYFIYFLVLNIRDKLLSMANGSVFQNLKTDILKQFKFINPTKNELIKFSEIVEPLMNKIKKNVEENITLEQLRDTILPKLMNSEIYLENIEI